MLLDAHCHSSSGSCLSWWATHNPWAGGLKLSCLWGALAGFSHTQGKAGSWRGEDKGETVANSFSQGCAEHVLH